MSIMSALHRLPEEIIFEFLSYLNTDDYINLSSACRRFHSSAMQILYKNIRVRYMNKLADPDTSKVAKFAEVFDRYPTRAEWIKSADFSWWEGDRATQGQIYNVLMKCSSISDLRLYICDQRLIPAENDVPRRLAFEFNPYSALLQSPFASSLRRLSVDDCNICYTDLDTIFSLPALKYVKIAQFNDKVSARAYPTLDLVPTDPPKVACVLTELEIWWSSPPAGEWEKYILKPHTQLQKLTWIGGHRFHNRYFAPSEVSNLLELLKDTLVELRLSLPVYRYAINGGLADLSEFNGLKVLNIDYGMLMCSDLLHFLRSPQFLRRLLTDRLPSSLESLTVSQPLSFINQ
jgi:hypothetical protein